MISEHSTSSTGAVSSGATNSEGTDSSCSGVGRVGEIGDGYRCGGRYSDEVPENSTYRLFPSLRPKLRTPSHARLATVQRVPGCHVMA